MSTYVIPAGADPEMFRADATAAGCDSIIIGIPADAPAGFTAPGVYTSSFAANSVTLQSRAAAALASNRTFLALASPTNAQVLAQVQALTKQNTALIRLLLNQFDGTD